MTNILTQPMCPEKVREPLNFATGRPKDNEITLAGQWKVGLFDCSILTCCCHLQCCFPFMWGKMAGQVKMFNLHWIIWMGIMAGLYWTKIYFARKNWDENGAFEIGFWTGLFWIALLAVVILTSILRYKIRQAKAINGNFIRDFFCTFFSTPCILCPCVAMQMAAEVSSSSEIGGLWSFEEIV